MPRPAHLLHSHPQNIPPYPRDERVVQRQDASFLAAITGVRRLGILLSQFAGSGEEAEDKLTPAAETQRPVDDILNMHLPCSFNHLHQSALEHRLANESAAQLTALGKLRPQPASLPVRIVLRAADSERPTPLRELPCEGCLAAENRDMSRAGEALASRLGAPAPAYVARLPQLAGVIADALASATQGKAPQQSE